MYNTYFNNFAQPTKKTAHKMLSLFYYTTYFPENSQDTIKTLSHNFVNVRIKHL